MRNTPLRFSIIGVLLCALVSLVLPRAYADTALSAAAQAAAAPLGASVPAISASDALAELRKLQVEQDQIKQQTSTATTGSQLDALDNAAQELSTEVANLSLALLPQRAQLQAQLDVLGPPPAPGAPPETPAVAEQRASLDASKAQVDAALKQASDETANLTNLNQQFANLRRNLLRNQLALNSGSILGAQFWQPLYRPMPDDRQRLDVFNAQIGELLNAAWQPGKRLVTVLLSAAALGIWLFGRRLLEHALAWLCLNQLPETRVRRSALALCGVVATALCADIAIQLLLAAFTRGFDLPPVLQDLESGLIKVALTCAMIEGLTRALLSTTRPSWRLPVIADPVAHAMRPFGGVLAGLLFIAGTLEQINRTADTSLQVTLFGRGIVSLIVVLVIGASLLRANRVRAALASAGTAPEARSAFAGLLHAAVSLAVVAALIALLIGYITVARFITYELVWFEIVLGSLFILSKLTRDACETFFAGNRASGQIIKHLFGVGDKHLTQVSTLLSGIGKSVLVVIAVVALVTGGFGTTPSDLLDSLLNMLGGDTLRKLNIVPDRILNAAIGFGVGSYLLRSVRRWLDQEFLPTLGMDPGMRASLITLLNNTGYVVLALLTLALLGVKWDNLAWIVSALSVGIGFGLQEIVKNFVSGLILLTERPVKVGDTISISGVEGDIRRINVRATEIQLGDRSTVIVPNSQLISQNLRNVTMGNSAQGVATLALTFPLNIDPEQVRELLLDAFRRHASILDKPAPSVTFSQLTPEGITLSVTGYVNSPRIAGDTKSDLLFEILKQLRAAQIPLSNPQTLILQNPSQLPDNV